jgi:hypothetical protein
VRERLPESDGRDLGNEGKRTLVFSGESETVNLVMHLEESDYFTTCVENWGAQRRPDSVDIAEFVSNLRIRGCVIREVGDLVPQ